MSDRGSPREGALPSISGPNGGKGMGRIFNSFLCGTPAGDYLFQTLPYEEQTDRAAAGLSYGGKRFTDNFGEFIEKYGKMHMTDMYSAGFYPFPTQEAKWGYWSKHSWLNRIRPEGLPLYREVYSLVKDRAHFVLTTNVDHQFWKAGFADENIFATQGD